MMMKGRVGSTLCVAVVVAWGMSAGASAAVVPFVEDFPMDSANWYDGAGAMVLDWSATGGPDGGSHAVGVISLAGTVEGDPVVAARAQDKWGSSGNAFVGDWIADGVTAFSVSVRHDAPFPLTFFVRFSSPFNFPGGIAVNFAPVFAGEWTQILIPIDPANPQFVSFEGSDFATVFSNIGHVQIGVSVAAGQEDFAVPITVDVDKAALDGCTPQCAGLECGDDGCGGSCGQCAPDEFCKAGTCVLTCVPDCSGLECGDDGCGGSCGTCPEGHDCSADGRCAIQPIPTVSEWGLVILALALVIGAKLWFRPSVLAQRA